MDNFTKLIDELCYELDHKLYLPFTKLIYNKEFAIEWFQRGIEFILNKMSLEHCPEFQDKKFEEVWKRHVKTHRFGIEKELFKQFIEDNVSKLKQILNDKIPSAVRSKESIQRLKKKKN